MYSQIFFIRNGFIAHLQTTSEAIATLDVLCSFAFVSEKQGYVRPVIDDSMEIEIVKGRHPVIEQAIGKDVMGRDSQETIDAFGDSLIVRMTL